jgi:hypothetical protein
MIGHTLQQGISLPEQLDGYALTAAALACEIDNADPLHRRAEDLAHGLSTIAEMERRRAGDARNQRVAAGRMRARKAMERAQQIHDQALKFALALRVATPDVSQSAIARSIKTAFGARAAGLPALRKMIARWEVSGRLPKRTGRHSSAFNADSPATRRDAGTSGAHLESEGPHRGSSSAIGFPKMDGVGL